jgi:hypothetical protein
VGSQSALRSAAYEVADSAQAPERSAAETLARGLALALGDASVRQEVKQALAASEIKEGKLHFTSFMQGRGGNIAAAAARRGGPDAAAFTTAIAAVRDLEFYMPVDGHRATWSGGADVLVAVQVIEEEAPVAFTSAGERRVLSLETPPAEPVLVLVTSEAVFGRQVALNERGQRALGCTVPATETLGAAMQRCTAAGEIGTSAPGSSKAQLGGGVKPNLQLNDDPYFKGMYLTFARILDLEEPWSRGDPEVELHAIAKRSAADGAAKQFQCSGEHAVNAAFQPGNREQRYVYDQNNAFWGSETNTTTGGVLALNPTQLDTAQAAVYDGANYAIWEDDDDPCRLKQKDTDDYFKNAVTGTASVVQGLVSIFVTETPNYGTAAGHFGSALNDLYELFRGGDDYIGLLVEKEHTVYANDYPYNTHIIYQKTTFNGRATMVTRR